MLNKQPVLPVLTHNLVSLSLKSVYGYAMKKSPLQPGQGVGSEKGLEKPRALSLHHGLFRSVNLWAVHDRGETKTILAGTHLHQVSWE